MENNQKMNEEGKACSDCGSCGENGEWGHCAGGHMGCNCLHHKVMPVLIIAFGALFLLGYMGYVTEATVSLAWPIIVIIAGLKKMFAGMCKCC